MFCFLSKNGWRRYANNMPLGRKPTFFHFRPRGWQETEGNADGLGGLNGRQGIDYGQIVVVFPQIARILPADL